MVYVRLLILAVIAIMAVVLLWYRGQYLDARAAQDKAETALNVANEANRMQRQAIERITELRAQNDAILLDISERLDGINSNVIETNSAVSELEKSNAPVREYLSGNVPDELRRLLNNR